MGIKEVSVSYRSYFKTMRASVRPKYEEAVALYEKKLVEEKALYSDVKLNIIKEKRIMLLQVLLIPFIN